jgi:phosphate transport system protein
LRIVNSYIKVAYDFERYGRYAWDITFTCKRLGTAIECGDASETMEALIQKTLRMVDISVKALKHNDANLAKDLSAIEQEVDNLYFTYMDQLAKTSTHIKCAMGNLLVAKFLERIADHTAYVGESILYIVYGAKTALR